MLMCTEKQNTTIKGKDVLYNIQIRLFCIISLCYLWRINKKNKNKPLIFYIMKTFDIILQGDEATMGSAIDLCNGLDWSEVEVSEQNLPNKRYKDTINGIDIYYDFAADYYFFSPSKN